MLLSSSIPVSQMICQQAFTVSSKIASHLANIYALEYNCKWDHKDFQIKLKKTFTRLKDSDRIYLNYPVKEQKA